MPSGEAVCRCSRYYMTWITSIEISDNYIPDSHVKHSTVAVMTHDLHLVDVLIHLNSDHRETHPSTKRRSVQHGDMSCISTVTSLQLLRTSLRTIARSAVTHPRALTTPFLSHRYSIPTQLHSTAMSTDSKAKKQEPRIIKSEDAPAEGMKWVKLRKIHWEDHVGKQVSYRTNPVYCVLCVWSHETDRYVPITCELRSLS